MTFTTVTIVPAALLAAVFVLALHGVRRLQGTTLVAPCIWVLISTASLLLVAILPDVSAATRFTAAATTFCPLMAVLGAKRPQDRGWQWVVATLWLVLVWPAGQSLLMQSGELQLFAAWKLFLVGLVAVGLLNYLPTRYWLSSLLVGAGQMALLGEFLWQVPTKWQERALPIAVMCFLVASMLPAWPRNSPTTSEGIDTFTHRWLWFRDAYGAFWALRILGRVNEAARLRRWPLRLTWQGFEVGDGASPTGEQRAELEETLRTLLRRFV